MKKLVDLSVYVKQLSNQQMKFYIQAFSLNNSHFKKADEINLFLINV